MEFPGTSAMTSEEPTTNACCSDARLEARCQQETHSGSVVIEMRSLRGRSSGERQCFICLQDGGKESPLISCCSTCYACTHVRCWREWRNNQRLTALRSRLLGLRMQTNHLLRCTICKSGTAVLAGEEDGLEWMNELLCGSSETGDDGAVARVASVNLPRRDDTDEDDDPQFEDLVDMRACISLVVYLAMLIVVLVVACTLIITQQFYAGDVVLCCIILLYELCVLQVVALAIAWRRGAMAAAVASVAGHSIDVEAQQNARDVRLATH